MGKSAHLAENFSIFPRPSKQAEEEYLKLEHGDIFPLPSQRDINPIIWRYPAHKLSSWQFR